MQRIDSSSRPLGPPPRPAFINVGGVRALEREQLVAVMQRLLDREQPSLLAMVPSTVALTPDPTTPKGDGQLYLALSRQGFCAYKGTSPARLYKLTDADLARVAPQDVHAFAAELKRALAGGSLDGQMKWVVYPVIDRVTSRP